MKKLEEHTYHPLLEVKHLNIYFKVDKKHTHIIRDVSFHINEGETVGLVGESGCGKSVTAKSLVKLLPSHKTRIEGTINYQNNNLILYTDKEMEKIRGKEIGFIFQDPMLSLNPTLKISHQIMEGYLRHYPKATKKEALEFTLELLELVGIPHAKQRMDSYPHTLSGGQRQRVMIALALASKPKFLIADEPTTALDVTIQAQILDLLKTIQKKMGMSILLISHDLSVVASFCDRILVMYGGKIIESAPVDKFFSNPQHPYTQKLLAAIPRLDRDKNEPLIPIEGTPPDLATDIKGCSFASRCPFAMNICLKESPPLFQIKEEQESACWMHDKRRTKEVNDDN